MKLSSKDGKPVMDVSAIDVTEDAMVVHAKVGGSLKMAIYLKPEDLYEARTLVMGTGNKGKIRGILRLYRQGAKLAKVSRRAQTRSATTKAA